MSTIKENCQLWALHKSQLLKYIKVIHLYISITNNHGNVPLVVNTSRPFLIHNLSCLCYSIFSLMCMFCRSLFVLLYFFFWPLCCLFFFDIRILITSFGIFKLFLNKHKLKTLTHWKEQSQNLRQTKIKMWTLHISKLNV